MKKTLRNFLRYIPLLAPIPEAYAVGIAIQRELDWFEPVIWVAALIVAGTGFWGVQVMNAMAEFNATLYQDEKKMKLTLPTWKAGLVLSIWFIGVTLLTVFLDAVPFLHDWTPLGLVVIGFSASYLFSLSNLHATREEERAAYRQKKQADSEAARNQRKADKQAAKQQAQVLASKKQEIAQKMHDRGVKVQVKKGAKLSDELLLLKWAIYPTHTPTEMANQLMDDGDVEKITRQAVSGRLKKMIKDGLVVVDSSGRVVEVINSGENDATRSSDGADDIVLGSAGGVGEKMTVESEAGES